MHPDRPAPPAAGRLAAALVAAAFLAPAPAAAAPGGAVAGTPSVPPTTPARTASTAPAGRFVFRTYSAPVPADWEVLPPASSFRAAQYRVPAAPGAEPGEMVVFYFGPGQGGPVDANIERWVSQFTSADGKPVRPRIERLKAAGLPVTVAELHGRYARGVGGGSGVARPGQALVAAIVETPEGNLTFQLHGDEKTVARHRAAFQRMLEGFQAGR